MTDESVQNLLNEEQLAEFLDLARHGEIWDIERDEVEELVRGYQNYLIEKKRADEAEALAETLRAEVGRLREAARGSTVVVNAAAAKIREIEAENERLREVGTNLLGRMFDTYKARNGREVSIQGDDGEKCWIVHSDEIAALEAAHTSKEKRDEN